MIAILEKYEHNQDFHQIVDFVEASHIRTVSESSVRINLKLNDEAGISSLPDAELFENLTLMGYNISPNQKFTFQKGQFSHQWKYIIHTIMQCLSRKSIRFNEFSSNIATALVCLATNRVYNFSKMIFDGLGEGSGAPTEPHHTPSPEVQQTSPTTHSSPSLPPVPTESLPTVIPTDTTLLRHYTKRARIAQSSALPPIADEPVSPLGDDSQGEACPTDYGLKADQDRANIPKTSTLPSDSTPSVTYLDANEGSMQQKLDGLMALCTSLQRQQSKMVSKFEAQELEINSLKARIKLLEDKDRGVAEQSGDNAPIKGRRLDKWEEAAKRVSDDTEEMTTVLTLMDASSILTSGGVQVVPTAAEVATATVSIPSGSGVVSTASPTIPAAALIFTTATESTPYTRRKGKEIMVDSETPKKKKAGWKAKHFKRMTLEEIKEKFDPVWKQIQDFILIGSKEEAERFKRKDLLKHLDGEDLNQLWRLVKESLSIRTATSDKEMELWVELKRLYEPDAEDQLWTHTQNMMHALIEWKLYDSCGVHHVTSKDKEISMLVEKDYPLKKGLAIIMISYKLQVENYSQMANDLILKIYKIASSPRQQDD
nr:synaptobrevin, longin-like domain protein [Tanacetum cinerariifolium]